MEAFCDFLKSEYLRNLLVFSGLLVAIVSVLSAKNTARRKQTADLMFGTRADKELSEGYKFLQTLHDANDQNIRHYAKREMRHSEEANKIRYVINHWERVCVGLRQGIYDETMLKEANFHTVLGLYKQASPYIEAIRENEGVGTYYQCLQELAERWKKKPLAKIQK